MLLFVQQGELMFVDVSLLIFVQEVIDLKELVRVKLAFIECDVF